MNKKDEALKMAIEFIENVFDGEWNWPFNSKSPIKNKEQLLDYLKAALSEPETVTLPDGWKAVPVELTTEMITNAQLNSEIGAYIASEWANSYDSFQEFYNALLASAPKLPKD